MSLSGRRFTSVRIANEWFCFSQSSSVIAMPAPTLEDLYLLCLFVLRCRLSVVSLSAQSRRFMQWMFGRRRLSHGSARPADWICLSDWNCLGTMIFSLSANRLVFVTTQSQAVDCRIRTRWISRLNLSLKLKYAVEEGWENNSAESVNGKNQRKCRSLRQCRWSMHWWLYFDLLQAS